MIIILRDIIRFIAYTVLFGGLGGCICRFLVNRGEAQYCFFIMLLITIPYIWFYSKDCNELKEIDYYKNSK